MKRLNFSEESRDYSLIERYERELQDEYQDEEYLVDLGFHVVGDGRDKLWSEVFFI